MKKNAFLVNAFMCLLLVITLSSNRNKNERNKNNIKNTIYFEMQPIPFNGALKNPLMGFTTRGIYNHPWASTAFTYIKWNEIENDETDGIEKIKNFCNKLWLGVEKRNVKVIPRVYLHWSGDKKFWPADMQTNDYSSNQFQKRVVKLIQKLGECWDNDGRVAFVEIGIFGKWGEQHSPSPTIEMQKIVGDAFAKAFKNKKVSVRHNWMEFQEHPFGEYWDSWAHYDQMWKHGNEIKKLNNNGRYITNYIGGEVAYGWGNVGIQPGLSPTESVAIEKHTNFIINTIRWLHCTQLRWIENYDQKNELAVKGAEEIQKAFGYRFEINKVSFSMSNLLHVAFEVTNTGSAPFYYNWPVEVALLDTKTLQPVWKSVFTKVDIRKWLPGEGWTDPNWKEVKNWAKFLADSNWNNSKNANWKIHPQKNKIEESFNIKVAKGTYIFSLAILDPSGNLPSIKLATSNYLNGGRHPFGIMNTQQEKCFKLPVNFKFDNPNSDTSLHYVNTIVISK